MRDTMSSQGSEIVPRNCVIVSADWGREVNKRAVYLARCEPAWTVTRESPPNDGWTLEGLVELGRGLGHENGAPVLIGIDAALGLPSAFAEKYDTGGFTDWLLDLWRTGGLEDESPTAAAWSPERPFFGVPPGKGSLSAFIEAAGGRQVLFREIERLTGGKSTFIVRGIPGSVGSGSRALWRETAALIDEQPSDVHIWPFDGSLEQLTCAEQVVLAETYPRASYAVALSEQLPAALRPIAKTKAPARAAALDELQQAAWLRTADVSLEDLGPAYANEDDFDALMTAAALMRLVAESRPLADQFVDAHAEGGMLGTSGIDFDLKRESRPRTRRPAARREPRQGLRCPIVGCTKVFASGRGGWDSHVASLAKHRSWHPGVPDGDRRKALFREAFQAWFKD